MNKRGKFITIEGTDGSGKSTQIELLKKYFADKGIDVVFVRDPGSTQIGEKIRSLILDIQNTAMSDETEALLYAACRIQLVNEVILPSLESGKTVICDRFVDSSIAYQGFARGLGQEKIEQVNSFSLEKCMPDLTIFFNIPPEKGMLRKNNQKKLDRIEQESINFHKKVYSGYLSLLNAYPQRIHSIDASLSVDEVFNNVKNIIEAMRW